MSISRQDKIRGSLLGGAIGDALGYPVEFMSYSQIKSKYGEEGITRFELDKNGVAEISDDTQMTLFTVNGLLFGFTRAELDAPLANPEDYIRDSMPTTLVMPLSLYISYRMSSVSARPLGSLNRVVTSQKSMPGIGKSGTVRNFALRDSTLIFG